MDRTRRNIYLTVACLGLFVVTLLALFVHRMTESRLLSAQQMKAEGAYVFDQARPIPSFQLVGADGKPFGPADLTGHWSLIYFGYSHCPDSCRAVLASLARFGRRITQTRYAHDTRIYLVSVDPARDTPAVLKRYLGGFGTSIEGVTGSVDAIRQFAFQLNIAFNRVADSDGGYSVAYTPSVVLVNPAGRYQGLFKPPFGPKQLEQLYVSARKQVTD